MGEKKRHGGGKLVDNAGSSIIYMKRDVICSLMLLYSNGEIYYFQRFSSVFLAQYCDKLIEAHFFTKYVRVA